MDILKMSKIENLKKVLEKTCKKQVQSIMLWFLFFQEKCCEHNFFEKTELENLQLFGFHFGNIFGNQKVAIVARCNAETIYVVDIFV
jgi:hypothetical protein